MTRIPLRVGVAMFLCAVAGQAVPVIGPPVNQASFLRPEFGQYGIARGAMFAVFGQEIGPAELTVAPDFPLPTELEGTSVQATVNGVTVNCIMVFVSGVQLAAILPSTTPLGEGSLTVTRSGETSEPVPILVVENGIGVFTVRQDGQGPGVITDVNFQVNSPILAHQPGERAIAWVTGLGARPRDDVSEVQDLRDQFDIEVFVGNEQAETFYAGPSGCCGAVDVVHFDIPAAAPLGCFVPVFMRIGTAISNFVTMSIAAEGRTCGDPHGLPAEMVDRIFSQGSIRIGFFVVTSLSQNQVFVNVPPPAAALRAKPNAVPQGSADGIAPFVGFATLQLVEQTAQNYWYNAQPRALGTAIGEIQVAGVDSNRFAATEVPLSGSAILTLMGQDGPISTVPMAPSGNVLTSPAIEPDVWAEVNQVMLEGSVSVAGQIAVRVAQTNLIHFDVSNVSDGQTSVSARLSEQVGGTLLTGRTFLEIATSQPVSTEAATLIPGSAGMTLPEASGIDSLGALFGNDHWGSQDPSTITEISTNGPVYSQTGQRVGEVSRRWTTNSSDDFMPNTPHAFDPDRFFYTNSSGEITVGSLGGDWTVNQYSTGTRQFDIPFADMFDSFPRSVVQEYARWSAPTSFDLAGVDGSPFSGTVFANVTDEAVSGFLSSNLPPDDYFIAITKLTDTESTVIHETPIGPSGEFFITDPATAMDLLTTFPDETSTFRGGVVNVITKSKQLEGESDWEAYWFHRRREESR